MHQKSKMAEILWIVNLILVFLLAVYFKGFPEKYILIWGAVGSVIFWYLNKTICLDLDFLILAMAVIVHSVMMKYYFTDALTYTWDKMGKAIMVPLLLYLVAKQMQWKQSERKTEIILIALGLGTFFYSLLNYWSYLQEGPIGRVWKDFWIHIPIYATQFSYWGVFIVGLLGYGFYCLCERMWIRGVCILVCIGVVNYINIVVDNRMLLVITIIVMVMNVFLYLLFNRKNKKRVRMICLTVLVIVFQVIGVFLFNVGGIKDTIYFTHFIERDGGIFRNVRFSAMWEAICLIPSHWKGGGTMHAGGFNGVHNYWLQVADDAGAFPFIMWMIFNLSALYSVFELIGSPYVSQRIKYMLIPMLGAVVAYLMMETGGRELTHYIIFYIILVALMKQLLDNKKHEKNGLG